ncbi:MAG: hypothetical protein JXB85_15275 [Anaerolineales bacterium]|nr:hypothetical protein [Anaerolineales bacterium]
MLLDDLQSQTKGFFHPGIQDSPITSACPDALQALDEFFIFHQSCQHKLGTIPVLYIAGYHGRTHQQVESVHHVVPFSAWTLLPGVRTALQTSF